MPEKGDDGEDQDLRPLQMYPSQYAVRMPVVRAGGLREWGCICLGCAWLEVIWLEFRGMPEEALEDLGFNEDVDKARVGMHVAASRMWRSRDFVMHVQECWGASMLRDWLTEHEGPPAI